MHIYGRIKALATPRSAAPQTNATRGRMSLAGATLLLALAGLIAGASWPGDRADASHGRAPASGPAAASPAGQTPPGVGSGAGYLLLAGLYLPPPYIVSVSGAVITINGYVYADYTFNPPPITSKSIDESDPTLGAYDLLELARRYYVANATEDDPAGSDTATAAYAHSLAAAPDVLVGGGLLTVSAGGEKAKLILDGPSWAGPADGDVGAAMAAAASLRTELARNVLLLTSQPALMELNRDEGVPVLQLAADLLKQGLDLATRTARLGAVLHNPVAAADLASNFVADADLLARLIADTLPALAPAPPLAPDPGGTPEPAPESAVYADFNPVHHPDSDTTGSKEACIFSTAPEHTTRAGAPDAPPNATPDVVKQFLVEQHYEVTMHIASLATFHIVQDAPGKGHPVLDAGFGDVRGDATIAAFAACHGGAVYVETHGFDRGLAIERYRTQDEASFRYLTLEDDYPISQLSFGQTPDGFFYVTINNKWISDNWTDYDTVLYLIACHGASTFDGGFNDSRHEPTFATPTAQHAGVREFVSYKDVTTFGLASAEAVMFWGAMDGIAETGNKRTATLAYSTIPDANLEYHQRTGEFDLYFLQTTLSPAVAEAKPARGASHRVGHTYYGSITFDSGLNAERIGNAANVVRLSGCLSLISASWIYRSGTTAGKVVLFTYLATVPGTANITVPFLNTPSFNNNNYLDGNTNPPGRDHVGPNWDDYTYPVGCVPDTPIESGGTLQPGGSGTTPPPVTPVPPTPTTTPVLPPGGIAPVPSGVVTPTPPATAIPTPAAGAPSGSSAAVPACGEPTTPTSATGAQMSVQFSKADGTAITVTDDTTKAISFSANLGPANANCRFVGVQLPQAQGPRPNSVYEQAPAPGPVPISGTTDSNGVAKGSFQFLPLGSPGTVTFVIATGTTKAAGTLQVVPPGRAP